MQRSCELEFDYMFGKNTPIARTWGNHYNISYAQGTYRSLHFLLGNNNNKSCLFLHSPVHELEGKLECSVSIYPTFKGSTLAGSVLSTKLNLPLRSFLFGETSHDGSLAGPVSFCFACSGLVCS